MVCFIAFLLVAPFASPSVTVADTVELPAPVAAFLAESSGSYGRLHPEAPPETAQFGQFAGVWKTVTHAYANEQWYTGWPAIWAWKYTIDGFGIEDLWYQRKEDLSPPRAPIGRDLQFLSTRVYDPAAQHWRVTWISNAAGLDGSSSFGLFDAVYEDGRIVMTRPTAEGQSLSRVVFSNITEEAFTWTSEVSEDGGATWESRLRLEARRIR